MKFLEKKWVRRVGVIPMLFYTLLSYLSVCIVINSTLFRPPNKVFPMTDGIGWIGYLFFLGIIFSSGVAAIVTAYYMKGVYRLLYLSGLCVILASASYLPLSFTYNGDYTSRPYEKKMNYFVGNWKDNYRLLELYEDSTFRYNYSYTELFGEKKSENYNGRWIAEENSIHLISVIPKIEFNWWIVTSDGYYFIRYDIPENLDAWSGNLGMMREDEWNQTH